MEAGRIGERQEKTFLRKEDGEGRYAAPPVGVDDPLWLEKRPEKILLDRERPSHGSRDRHGAVDL